MAAWGKTLFLSEHLTAVCMAALLVVYWLQVMPNHQDVCSGGCTGEWHSECCAAGAPKACSYGQLRVLSHANSGKESLPTK